MGGRRMGSSGVVLAFDFGLKRIGVAVGQSITKTATPLGTLVAKSGEPPWDRIAALLSEWQPTVLVVGIPLNMDGTEQPMTQNAKQFAGRLQQRSGIPVSTVDERLTTREARSRLYAEGGYKRIKGADIDSLAAKLILETWFSDG